MSTLLAQLAFWRLQRLLPQSNRSEKKGTGFSRALLQGRLVWVKFPLGFYQQAAATFRH